MTDQTKNGPINIPIESDDDAPTPPAESDDDIIEIDGDAVDFDEDLTALDAEAADVAAEPESGPIAEPETEPVPELDAADAEEPFGFEADVEDEQAAKEGPAKPAEISREAVFEMMQELRQKTEQIARMTDEKNDLMDRLLRKQAEFENFRKRGEREMHEAYGRARADLMGELLPVIDNFDLALHHAENASSDVIHEGVQLIYKQLMDTLGRLGLESIEAEGLPFDPELHDAVATEPNEEVPDHTVVGVLQRGFKLGDRMLRPARVKVAVQP
jgi:molecular chaperone GrpE